MSSELALGTGLVVLLLASNVAFGVAWSRARKRAARLELAQAEVDASASGLRFDGARAKRLEDLVESMALEIERIGEGQRFTSRLLAESRRIQPRHGVRRSDPGAAH